MIDKSQLFAVINESYSPVAVHTKTDSILIDGAEDSEPAAVPFTFEDIAYINSTSSVFKTGLLFFAEKEHEQELYDALKIRGYAEIMHDGDIEDALLNPSAEKLQKILDIENAQYFERVRGVFTGLKNAGVQINGKVERIIRERFYEFSRKIYKTKIELKKAYSEAEQSDAETIKELERKVAVLSEKLSRAESSAPKYEKTEKTHKECADGKAR